MSAGWFVVDASGRAILGPFSERNEAVRRLWQRLRLPEYRNKKFGPLCIWHGDPWAFDPVSAFYPSGEAMPAAVWEAQRRGQLIVVRLDDGTYEAVA